MNRKGSVLGPQGVAKVVCLGGLLAAACLVTGAGYWLADNRPGGSGWPARGVLAAGGLLLGVALGVSTVPLNSLIERRFAARDPDGDA